MSETLVWEQYTVELKPRRRGFHLVTTELESGLKELRSIAVGWANFFLLHTSASLTINENADPDVLFDMESIMDRIVPEQQSLTHTLEGPDDMPAHAKCSLMGCSLVVPITAGRLRLGTWQGIYLGEHRNHATARTVVVTLQGRRA